MLKKKTRRIDRSFRVVTYRQLQTIIRRYGLELEQPFGNTINVIRVRDVDGRAIAPHRVAKIGFHSWKSEVSRKDIEIIRQAAQLTIQAGVDAQAFYFGVETPFELIKKYEQPLRRLAFR